MTECPLDRSSGLEGMGLWEIFCGRFLRLFVDTWKLSLARASNRACSTPRIRSTSSMAGARKAAKTSTPKGGNARRVVTAVSPSSKKAAPKQQPAKKKPATLNERFAKLKQSGRDAQQQRNTTARYAATMAKRTGQSAKKFAVRHSARSPPRTRRPLLTCQNAPDADEFEQMLPVAFSRPVASRSPPLTRPISSDFADHRRLLPSPSLARKEDPRPEEGGCEEGRRRRKDQGEDPRGQEGQGGSQESQAHPDQGEGQAQAQAQGQGQASPPRSPPRPRRRSPRLSSPRPPRRRTSTRTSTSTWPPRPPSPPSPREPRRAHLRNTIEPPRSSIRPRCNIPSYVYNTHHHHHRLHRIITTVYAFEPISSAVSRRRIANAGFLAADDARATLQLTRYFPATRLASFSSAVAAYVAVAAPAAAVFKKGFPSRCNTHPRHPPHSRRARSLPRVRTAPGCAAKRARWRVPARDGRPCATRVGIHRVRRRGEF